jgi:subunit length determinant Wzz-like protein
MSTSTERARARREPPDPDAEREIDLRSYLSTLALRWWLPAAGLVGGVAIGFLISLGGKQVYTARTTIYLGQPLSPTGSVQIQGPATNPSVVGTIIHSRGALVAAARQAGMPVGRLSGHVSSQPISGSLAKLGQTPLVQIRVTGSSPRRIALAANALARIVIKDTSHYVATKIATFKAQVDSYSKTLSTIDKTIAQLTKATGSSGLSTSDKLVVSIELSSLTLQRSQVVDQQTTARQLLSVAQGVENGQVINRAVASKTTARSRRNTVVVAALLGLLLGIFAALLWDPVARVMRRPS